MLRLQRYFMAVICAALVFSASSYGEEEEAPDPRALLREILSAKTSWEDRTKAGDKMVKAADASVPFIMAGIDHEGVDQRIALFLLSRLPAIGTDVAVNAMKSLLERDTLVGRRALIQLALMNNPMAHAAVVSYKPGHKLAREAHVSALEHIPSLTATRILIDYLVDTDAMASARARQVMMRRIENNIADGVAQELREKFEELLKNEDLAGILHIRQNLTRVASVLPGRAGQEFLRRCLGSNDTMLHSVVLDTVIGNPALLDSREIIDQIVNVLLQPAVDSAIVIKMLQALRQARNPGMLPVVAAMLDHQDRNVRITATTVMETLTGRNLGRNPAVWKEWYSKNQ